MELYHIHLPCKSFTTSHPILLFLRVLELLDCCHAVSLLFLVVLISYIVGYNSIPRVLVLLDCCAFYFLVVLFVLCIQFLGSLLRTLSLPTKNLMSCVSLFHRFTHQPACYWHLILYISLIHRFAHQPACWWPHILYFFPLATVCAIYKPVPVKYHLLLAIFHYLTRLCIDVVHSIVIFTSTLSMMVVGKRCLQTN